MMRWLSLLLVMMGCGPSSVPPSPESSEPSQAEPSQAEPSQAEPPQEVVPAPLSWRYVRLDLAGSGSIQPRPVVVLVPEVTPPTGGFPFLVATDGDLAFDEEWFGVDDALMQLVAEEALQAWVVIAVPAIDRTPELTPSLASPRALRRGERLESPGSGVEAFADYVVDVVLPAVAVEAPLRERGAVLGYSYGGLAAIHFGLRYPSRFPRVVAMSPSLWFSQRAALFAVDHASTLPSRVWLDVGTREGARGEAFPYMVADARLLRDDLSRRGVEVGYHEAIGRPHGSSEAGPRMRDALRFALALDDDDCELVRLTLHVFRRRSRIGHLVPTTVTGHCADGSPRTLSSRAVHLEAQGASVSVEGLVRASRPGDVTLRARYQGLEATSTLRFTRR